MKRNTTKAAKLAPILVYLESSMVLNRKTWSWVRANDNRIELLGYESAQEALDGLTQANLVMANRYVSVATPAQGANMKNATAKCDCAFYQGASCDKCAAANPLESLKVAEQYISNRTPAGPIRENVLRQIRRAIAQEEAR